MERRKVILLYRWAGRGRKENLSIPLIPDILTVGPKHLNLAGASLMLLGALIWCLHLLMSECSQAHHHSCSLVAQLSAPNSKAGLRNPYVQHFLPPLPLRFLGLKLIPTSAVSQAQFPLQTHMAHLFLGTEVHNLEGLQRDSKRH